MMDSILNLISRLKYAFQRPTAISINFEPDVRQKLAQLDDVLTLVRATEERMQTLELVARTVDAQSKTHESQLNSVLTLMRATEERAQILERAVQTVDVQSKTHELQLNNVLTFVRASEEHALTLERVVRVIDERSRTHESQLNNVLTFVRASEEHALTLERVMRIVEERSRTLESKLNDVLIPVRTAEERSKTLEYLARQSIYAISHQVEQLQKLYVESMPVVLDLKKRASFNASSIIELKTDFPIALGSNDHISPDSTMEGVSRPTFFVQDCIRVLGQDIKCLDLGTGAAGLVFEYAMSGVLAIGVDGSDFCRVNKIGYWPLLPNNLFTCDITRPFSFLSRSSQIQVEFNVITMWEVLEHIAESELPSLFGNISSHLNNDGYFIGSISQVEYADSDGKPYHITLKPRNWWKSKFEEGGLVMLDTHPFNEKLFCRGNGPRYQDIHNYALNPNEGFLFVAQKASK